MRDSTKDRWCLGDEARARMEQLYVEERMSLPQIAQRFGIHHTTVLYHLRRRGVPRRSVQEGADLRKLVN